jgi:hypothetical protein
MEFNKTQIKTITINMNTGSWNPETHDIVVTRDPKTALGFTVKLVSVDFIPTVVDVSQANVLLKKFTLK